MEVIVGGNMFSKVLKTSLLTDCTLMFKKLVVCNLIFFRTLIKRGADFNKEDYRGLRPDDLNVSLYHHDDCKDIITSHRALRLKHLTDVVQNVRHIWIAFL